MRGCSKYGMFSIGAMYPDKETAGSIKINEPRVVCCWVSEIAEMKSPIPTTDITKISIAKSNKRKEPLNSIPNIDVAAVKIIIPSSIPTITAGKALPMRISYGISGETSS